MQDEIEIIDLENEFINKIAQSLYLDSKRDSFARETFRNLKYMTCGFYKDHTGYQRFLLGRKGIGKTVFLLEIQKVAKEIFSDNLITIYESYLDNTDSTLPSTLICKAIGIKVKNDIEYIERELIKTSKTVFIVLDEIQNLYIKNSNGKSIIGELSEIGCALEGRIHCIITGYSYNLRQLCFANLSINQKQLVAAYEQVRIDIQTMQEAHRHLEHDVGVLFANLDNKLTVRNLQSLLQMTLLKMSQAISAAVQHHTSPFVFGTADLKNLSDVFRQKNVPLTDNINDVITSLAVVDNFYTFIFSAPILKTKNELHLYEIRDLPVYNKNLQYKAKVEHRYYAISLTSAEYTVLSDAEYYLCKNYFVCTAAAPFKIIGPNSPCELLTIKYQTNRCALEEFVGPAEQFLTYGNITYYSVPEPIEIHITCDESNGSTNRHQEIYGTGKIEIAPGCNIKISENANIRPSYVISRHNLEGDSFFKFLNVSGMPFVYPTTTKPPNVTRTPIVFREVASLKEAINIVFNQDTTLAEAIRMIIYLITIFSILATIYCCYPRFRLWFNGCCFITKPTKYWRDVRGYVVPDFISRNRQLQADNIGSIEKVDEIELQVVSAPREPEIKPSENKIAENIQPPYPFNRLTRLYSPLLINSLRKQ